MASLTTTLQIVLIASVLVLRIGSLQAIETLVRIPDFKIASRSYIELSEMFDRVHMTDSVVLWLNPQLSTKMRRKDSKTWS